MKRHALLLLCLCFLATTHSAANAGPKASEQRYIFYLHHKYVELFELDVEHPEYGRAEYHEIIKRFRDSGFVVLSEKRPKNTGVKHYAEKIVRQADSLLKLGVKPNHITVLGASKGGYIAQYVSTMLGNPEVNYVFIGAYQDSDLQTEPDISFCGNILSIYAADDSFGVSAIRRVETSKLRVPRFKEIELHTGIHHGFLYHPMDEWMLPAIQWARGDYSTLVTSDVKKLMDSILAGRPDKPFGGSILIQENGKTVYSWSSNGLTVKSQFRIASISKQFTAALVLLEMEKGRINLNDPISKYLTGLTMSWKDSITVYHLLTHTHGITKLDSALSFIPGTAMDYRNGNIVGFGLLGDIVQKTSGKSFVKLSMELFRKCGMKNTFHPDIKGYDHLVEALVLYPSCYPLTVESSTRQRTLPDNFVPAGGFISTAGDLVRWNTWLHEGKVLSPTSYKIMVSIQPGVVLDHAIWGHTEYGLGTTIRNDGNLLQYGQTGYISTYPSMNFYFPATKTSVIVLQNHEYGLDEFKDKFYYHTRILNMLRDRLKCGKEVAMPPPSYQ